MALAVRYVLAVALTVVGAALPLKAATRRGKPVYDEEVLPVVASSLARMWAAADAVAVVQITSSVVKSIDLAPAGNQPHVRTFHTGHVVRVYKGTVKEGEGITFTQAAGELELPDKIIRIPGVQPLAAGERYVLFLKRHEVFGPWMLVGERDGAFKIRGGRIEPQGFGPVAEQKRNVPEAKFSDELERLARLSLR